MVGVIEDLIKKELKAIRNIPIDDNIGKAVDLIFHAVHFQRKNSCGWYGKAGQIGYNVATTFSSTGTQLFYASGRKRTVI